MILTVGGASGGSAQLEKFRQAVYDCLEKAKTVH
jgi:hypothetical protein